MCFTKEKTTILGDEFDDELRSHLMEVLQTLNAKPVKKKFGIGGSQELEEFVVKISGVTIRVEAETYVGLSIFGKASMVDKIASLVQDKIKPS